MAGTRDYIPGFYLNGPGYQASFGHPHAIAADWSGSSIFVGEAFHNVVRRISCSSGYIMQFGNCIPASSIQPVSAPTMHPISIATSYPTVGPSLNPVLPPTNLPVGSSSLAPSASSAENSTAYPTYYGTSYSTFGDTAASLIHFADHVEIHTIGLFDYNVVSLCLDPSNPLVYISLADGSMMQFNLVTNASVHVEGGKFIQ
jgi:hypothetical protein